MRNLTEIENQELMLYLEELIPQMNKWVVTKCKYRESLYDKFMSYPYLKLCNNTFNELILVDIPI